MAGIQRSANAEGQTYRYSQFTDLYRSYVATLRRSMRQVHRAGEKLFVDYAGQTVPYGREGDRAQIFVAALGASHYTFACATAHQRLIDWTGALVRALEYIDGVPALIVPDSPNRAHGTHFIPETWVGSFCGWCKLDACTPSSRP